MADEQINTAAGLALHPGTLAPFDKKLADGPGSQALVAAKKAFEVCHTSISDMHSALQTAPKVGRDIVEDAKPALNDAMARSFERGAATIETAERIIEETHRPSIRRPRNLHMNGHYFVGWGVAAVSLTEDSESAWIRR